MSVQKLDWIETADLPDRSSRPIKTALAQWWRRSIRRMVTRRHLRQLPAHHYRDLGLTPGEVQRELNKPFWR